MHPKFTRMIYKTIEGSEKSKKNERYVQKIYDTKMKDLPITFSSRRNKCQISYLTKPKIVCALKGLHTVCLYGPSTAVHTLYGVLDMLIL